MTTIKDISEYGNGKYFEIVAYATRDENEKPDMIASKIRDKTLANHIAEYAAKFYGGYVEIVIR